MKTLDAEVSLLRALVLLLQLEFECCNLHFELLIGRKHAWRKINRRPTEVVRAAVTALVSTLMSTLATTTTTTLSIGTHLKLLMRFNDPLQQCNGTDETIK